MTNKYTRLGLRENDIIAHLDEMGLLDLEAYERAVKLFLDDEDFKEISFYLDIGDYALAQDAAKGLFYLAGNLYLYPLYESLLEVYADLHDGEYVEALRHYEDMLKLHTKFKGEFNV